MVLGYPIDWAATGAMLSGWGALAGAAAVAYAAYQGWRAFESIQTKHKFSFRSELIQETYNSVRLVFDFINNVRIVPTLEDQSTIGSICRDGPNVTNHYNDEEEKHFRQKLAEGFSKRWDQNSEKLSDISELSIRWKIFFRDDDMHTALSELNAQIRYLADLASKLRSDDLLVDRKNICRLFNLSQGRELDEDAYEFVKLMSKIYGKIAKISE